MKKISVLMLAFSVAATLLGGCNVVTTEPTERLGESCLLYTSHGHRPDHSPEGGGGTSRRHAGGSAAPCDGAGGVGDSAEGDRYDRE